MSGAQILTAGSLTASFHRNDGEEWVRATIKHGGRRVWIGLSASLESSRESALTFLQSRPELMTTIEERLLLATLAPEVEP